MKEVDFSALKQVGLSKNAIACYGALYAAGVSSAGDLAKQLGKPRTSIYHALRQLSEMGFVSHEKVEIFHQVTKFKAVRLDKALENLAISQRRALKQLIDYQVGASIKRQAILGNPVLGKDWR